MRKGLLMLTGAILVVALLLVGCAAEKSPGGQGGVPTVPLGGRVTYPPGGLPTAVSGGNTQSYQVVWTGNSQQTGIWVNGTGKVTVVPDVAILSLGVEAQATTVAEASSKAAGAMDGIMKVLTANGVAKKDIQTQWFNISPLTKWVEKTGEQIVIGYRVNNMVTAKIRDINKAGTIIDAVTEAGGDFTRVQGISFTVDDPTPYYNQAREKAMRDAIAKAQQMAEIASVELGKPIYITESGGYVPTPYPLKATAEAGAAPTTPISPGETEISISVQIVYAIK